MRQSELAGVLIIFLVLVLIYGAELVFWSYRIAGNQAPALFGSKYFVIVHVLAILGIAAFIDGFFIEPNWIEVRRFELEAPKLKNATFRMVLFSDTHCESRSRNEDKVVEIINGLEPDVIVFTGDALNRSGSLSLFQETLRKLHAPYGKFAVRGNYDGYRRNTNLFSQTGFKELDECIIYNISTGCTRWGVCCNPI